MKLTETTTIRKNIRFTFEEWTRIKKYAEGVDFLTESALLKYLIKRGIESAEEEAIDAYIEKEKKDGIKAYTYDGPPIKATLDEFEEPVIHAPYIPVVLEEDGLNEHTSVERKNGIVERKDGIEEDDVRDSVRLGIKPESPDSPEIEEESDVKPIDRTKFGTIPDEDYNGM